MNDYEYYYGDGTINAFSGTNIKDPEAIKFINSIKSRRFRQIIRHKFETESYFNYYTLNNFKEDFKKYLNDKNNNYYFLPGLNDRYEDILKKLLNI